MTKLGECSTTVLSSSGSMNDAHDSRPKWERKLWWTITGRTPWPLRYYLVFLSMTKRNWMNIFRSRFYMKEMHRVSLFSVTLHSLSKFWIFLKPSIEWFQFLKENAMVGQNILDITTDETTDRDLITLHPRKIYMEWTFCKFCTAS